MMKAEAWAVFEGVRLAASSRVSKLEIETDSLILASSLMSVNGCPVEIMNLVDAISSSLAGFRDWKVAHVWREANSCADVMANMGSHRQGCGVFFAAGWIRIAND